MVWKTVIGWSILVGAVAMCFKVSPGTADEPRLQQKSETKPQATEVEKKPPVDKPAKEPRKQTELGKFMRQKLDASGQILEGLLIEDTELLVKGANTLKEMSVAAKWRVSNDMMYRHHSEDFTQNVDKLIASGKGQSIDRAALDWFKVTLTCIECHRYVRSVLVAESESEKTLGLQTKLGSE